MNQPHTFAGSPSAPAKSGLSGALFALLLLSAFPPTLHGEEVRLLLGHQEAQLGTNWTLTGSTDLVFRKSQSVMIADGSGGALPLLAPEATFEVNDREYVFEEQGTFSQLAVFPVQGSSEVLVRCRFQEVGEPLASDGFLLLSTDGTVTNLIPLSELGPEVNPVSRFGICAAQAIDYGDLRATGVACILPSTGEEEFVGVLFGMGEGITLPEPITIALPELDGSEPANLHLNASVNLQALSGFDPGLATQFEAFRLPEPPVFQFGVRWDAFEDSRPPAFSRARLEHSERSARFGSPAGITFGRLVDWRFRRPLSQGNYLHSANTLVESGGEEVQINSVEISTGPVHTEGNLECDCDLVSAHRGGEEGIREDLEHCMGRPLDFDERCPRVNFSGGDTITPDDSACLGICQYTLKEGHDGEVQVQESLRYYIAREGDPLPVHSDLLYSHTLWIQGSNDGRAAIMVAAQDGSHVLLIYAQGEILAPFRSGDDFGHGELGRLSTGGTSNFNASGEVAIKLLDADGFSNQGIYLFPHAMAGEPPPPAVDVDGWILTSR